MKRIKKPLSVMLSFLLLLGALSSAPFTAGAAESEESYQAAQSVTVKKNKDVLKLGELNSAESHNHDDIDFSSWSLSDSLPAQAGDYMLTEDVTLTDQWNVPDGETNLCLNGHTIKQTADNQQVIYIGENSELNLFDCGGSGQITGGKGFYGGAVYIAKNASFTLNGGIIKDNEATSGAGVFADKYASFVMNGGSIERNNRIFDNDASGGVYLFSGSTFVMNGGSISNNYYGDTGGGVTVGSGSAFTMNGGSISANTNETSEGQGGGVYVYGDGSFTMNAGIISENTAEKGAGVYLDPRSVFTMSGGEISENEAFKSAGGVYYEDEAEFYLEGGVRITDNTVERDLLPEDSNVYLTDVTGMQVLYITDELDDNAEIGVSTAVEEPDLSPVVFTDGLDGNGSSSNFTSDQLYDIVLDYNGEAVIGEGVTISFEKGYEYVTGSMSNVSWCKNLPYKLPACEYDSNGFYDFIGWKFGDNETIMQPNKTVRITDDVTITAQWFSGWKDLQEKIDNAESGETITLIANCTADYGDVSLTIPENKELTIDLNGYTIDRRLSDGEAVANGNVITNNGSLTITDSSTGKNGVITGGNNTGGGGIHNYGELVIANGSVSGNSATYGGGIWTSKHLTVNGGFISGNTATDGGGIFFGGGTAYPLEINGGEIKNNSASGLGGGIFTSDDATVTGGVISGNTAKQGGGIYNSGRLDISGGTVSNNTATEYGGGIYDEPSAGTAYLRDTTITGNTASQGGGIYTEGRRIHLSGAPQVTGNKKNDNSDNNLFISDKMKMYVDDSFSSEANIGVSVTLGNVVSAVLTDGLAQSGATFEAFTSDNPKRTIIDDGNGEAEFIRIYGIKILSSGGNGKGKVTVDKTTALAGETVTVTATPNEGSELTSLIYNNSDITGNTFIVPKWNGDTIYVYAVFSIKTYTVTWQDEDGTELEVDENVEHFSTPSFDGTAPSKEGYHFVGWDDGENTYAIADLPQVTKDVTYMAAYAYDDGIGERLVGHSISLDGDIGVNFYLNLTPEEVNKARIKFRWFNKELEVSGSDLVYNSEQKLYKASCPVAVAEMTYDVNATLYLDGVEVEKDKYSVVKYANVILTDKDFGDSYRASLKAKYGDDYDADGKYYQLIKLVVAMLEYGARAQLVFDRNTDNLANNGLPGFMDEITSDSIKSEPDDLAKGLEDYGLEYQYSSIVFLSGMSLRHFYKVTDEAKYNAIKSTIKYVDEENGEKFAVEPVKRGDMIYFQKKNVAASKLDDQYVLKIGDSSYRYSVMDGIKLMMDASPDEHNMELCKATYRYNQMANDFFGD